MDCLKSLKQFFRTIFCISSCCDKNVNINVNKNNVEEKKHKPKKKPKIDVVG